jgi:hypothetical protein
MKSGEFMVNQHLNVLNLKHMLRRTSCIFNVRISLSKELAVNASLYSYINIKFFSLVNNISYFINDFIPYIRSLKSFDMRVT